MIRCVVFTVVLCATGPSVASGGAPAPQPKEQEVKSLIDRLVSPNPKPITSDEDRSVAPGFRLPPGYDDRKQLAVERARLQLEELGRPAFPFLIERWDDRRYCLSVPYALSGDYRNYNVGELCQTIIFDQLQPYGYLQWTGGQDLRRTRTRPRYPKTFLFSRDAARKWWEKNKDKTLVQMQLEVVDWIIAEEGKDAHKYTEKEREYLKQARRKLVAGKPLSPGNYSLDEWGR
jgi:hypothetical protein